MIIDCLDVLLMKYERIILIYKGINSDEEYVATQAPVTASKYDFWRMIWEKKCKNIVMLTQLVESGKWITFIKNYTIFEA